MTTSLLVVISAHLSTMCVMVDQREALAITTHLLTRFIWFALPGFKPSTLGSVSSNPAFYLSMVLD